jgi:uncharacterized Tic20 family protein
MDLFNQQPLLLQLMPHLDRGLMLGINRIGQVIILVGALMAICQDKATEKLPKSLQKIASLIRWFAAIIGWRWDRGVYGLDFPPKYPLSDEQLKEDVNIGPQFILSSVLLVILIAITDRGPFGWIAFPFEVAWRGITVWFEIKFSIWSIIGTILGSYGRLCGFPFLLLFSIVACVIIVRPYAFLLSKTAELIPAWLYRTQTVIVCILGVLLTVITT